MGHELVGEIMWQFWMGIAVLWSVTHYYFRT